MRSAILTTAALLALTTTPALAADWSVDPDRSSLAFVFTQGGTAVTGVFDAFDADITFDPTDLAAARVFVTVDIASIRTGDSGRDTQARGQQWFATGDFATAIFDASTFAEGDAPGRYVATGDLTIRGVTQTIDLPFDLVIDGDTATATGELVLNRGTFGVGQGDFQSGGTVGLEVTVAVDLVATRI